MIEYLKNNEIDKDLWDNCIRNSHVKKPYGYSWYLDSMAPGWQAMVDDDYDSVFPVPGFTRFGIQYIATPVFLQQLGAFSPDKPSPDVLIEFLEYLPEFYKLVDLCVAQNVIPDGFRISERSNFELDLSQPYSSIWNNFDHACKRNIEKSLRKKIEWSDDIQPTELISLFKEMKEAVAGRIKQKDFDRLSNLMEYCIRTGKGRITGVRGKGKRLIFGQFIVQLHGYINLLFGVNTPESREMRLNYYYINELIKENSGTRNILDFAGSSIPSIASFMKSFGGINVPYYRLYRNRLFWPVRMLK